MNVKLSSTDNVNRGSYISPHVLLNLLSELGKELKWEAWRYVNDVTQMSINKEQYWLKLTLLRLEGRSRSHDISMFCIKKCKQPEMLVSSSATTLRNINIYQP